ncbi:hypothetical protein GCM10009804_73650 [Kribbella hippodromi]|uniref:REase associating with pPIWI RE domain-containing protein n=1 Tax=Kribbella hippodromi TaxID=434347 RepID=A0ABP4QH53_9ACTN
MSRIAPIQTHYAGCHFRSRLEARWAVFFDSLDIPWLYEPEGYHLGDAGTYLPDFLLYPDTTDALWFEVKGGFPRSDEIRKSQALSAGTGIRAFIYYAPLGLPAPDSLKSMSADEFTTREELWHWDNQDGWFSFAGGPMRWATNFAPTAFMFSPDDTGTSRTDAWWWTDCDHCGLLLLKIHGQVGHCPDLGEDPSASSKVSPSFGHSSQRLLEAYTAALSARFEFGAAGRPRTIPTNRQALSQPIKRPALRRSRKSELLHLHEHDRGVG